MPFKKSCLFGGLPLVGLLVATGATGKTLDAYFQAASGDNVPQGSEVRRCSDGSTIGAVAFGYESNGIDIPGCQAVAYSSGVTQSATTGCSNAAFHEVFFQVIDSADGGQPKVLCSGIPHGGTRPGHTTCWNSNLSTGACTTSCSVTVNSQYNNGSCANHTWTAASFASN